MPTFSDSMSGSGPYYLDLILTVTDTTEGSDPTTTFNWTLRIRRSASYGAGSFDGSIPWNWKFAGTTIASGSYNGNFPAGGATTWTVASGTRTVSMNSDGNRTASITASLTTSTTALGSGAVSDTWVMPRVPVPPTAPGPMVINSTGTTTADVAWGLAADAGGGTLISYTVQWDDVSNFASPASATTTVRNYDITGLTPANNYWTRARIRMSAGYGPYNAAKAFTTDPVAPTTPTAGTSTINTIPINWTKSTNGNAVTGFDIQYDTLSTFATATTVTVGNVTSYTLNGLPPGTTHYIRIRTKTSSGTSPWSGTLTKATITANPPGISVVASPSGTAATVTLTPPATGVTKYTIERQTGTSGPVTTYTTTTTPYSVSGLAPGTTYRWRASAWFDGYQTPFSSWVSVTQPRPNTNPGDYFDGSTPDTTYADFSWDSTVNNSTSTVRGFGVNGWATFAEATAVTAGGTGAVTSTVGTLFGNRAARVQFFSPPGAAGFRMGMSWTNASAVAEVEGLAPYFGSIYVNPSRAQRMAAAIVWLNASMTFVSISVGTAVVVPNGSWTRLRMNATAPATAQFAAVVAVDVAGTGWLAWSPGDEVLLDGAMITVGSEYTYFDGSFPTEDGYSYAWLGTANASESIRRSEAEDVTDPLADPDCPPLPQPPRPPTILDACIDEVTVWRRYWVAIPASDVSDWMIDLPTLRLTTGLSAVRQVRIRVYANPFNWALENVDPLSYCSEQIISYIPPSSRLTIDGALQRVFAEVNGGGAIAADHLLYGTGGIPATWPELTCGIAYAISVDVPLDAPEGNFSTDVTLTRRM